MESLQILLFLLMISPEHAAFLFSTTAQSRQTSRADWILVLPLAAKL
ncbi:MAG: hypothetical protein K0A99_11010 [Desulfoarculaceae bacterium]|nr:hypothetical protein [Desulfoarculaceae bacterium]